MAKLIVIGRWVAKLVARLLATAALGTNLDICKKYKNGRHKQSSDQL